MSKTSAQKTIEILVESEKIADDILVIKGELIALDKQRHETNEALRNVQKTDEKKVLITIGTMLVKVERERALDILQKEKVRVDAEINKLRSDEKIFLEKLRYLEYTSPIKGLNLKPLDRDEISAIKSNMPFM
uniref:P53 and DNA damage-regulated protein 1 n=1 Tax=Tabanus bromius TaxID=304241 RepID=A0A0K8TR70_TABBR